MQILILKFTSSNAIFKILIPKIKIFKSINLSIPNLILDK